MKALQPYFKNSSTARVIASKADIDDRDKLFYFKAKKLNRELEDNMRKLAICYAESREDTITKSIVKEKELNSYDSTKESNGNKINSFDQVNVLLNNKIKEN